MNSKMSKVSGKASTKPVLNASSVAKTTLSRKPEISDMPNFGSDS